MDIGFVGLRNDAVARRLAAAGVRVFGCDPDGRAEALATESIVVALPDAVTVAQALRAPRVAWLDLPTGFATELAIQDIWPEFAPGDVIVDAGDGTAADAARRTAALASAGIGFVACRVVADAVDGTLALAMNGRADAIGIVAPYADLVARYHDAVRANREGAR